MRLRVVDSALATKADTDIHSVIGGDFVRLGVTFTADETATWLLRVRQVGAGDLGWHVTRVSIRQVLLTPTLTVRPRVLLTS